MQLQLLTSPLSASVVGVNSSCIPLCCSFPNRLHTHHSSMRPAVLHQKSNHRRLRSSTEDSNSPDREFQENQEQEDYDLGVRAALSVLRFYKREISPVLPRSCRYVPTCSEYSMEAYKRYGFVKGTVLTAWRICRCNPLGGSGFDPPRWLGEEEHFNNHEDID